MECELGRIYWFSMIVMMANIRLKHFCYSIGRTMFSTAHRPLFAASIKLAFSDRNNAKRSGERRGRGREKERKREWERDRRIQHNKLAYSLQVSWIRRRDFQLLTVGLSTYSSDGRFLVEHARHMGHWSLRIKSVRDDDKGLYECQLSIHPTQSIFVELRVVG